ncbi:hypothetical protein XM38_012300 [Halomicronema hongdechloris C2206]|uniref:Uncharacterized protein n=1 Tax=Halomicronema hongdechloris C2206 TaxID=1641165 RepID=A0A1Z3HJ27_9CYAN|nr:hypothetical protein [Halomicronema hongdechloris]ASC70293.1 hypothetical protein XM38_012300 [Halomicronema hongdechloris C2206]
MTTTSYTFARRTHNLPDDIDWRRTFEAPSYKQALQMAADYWFGGQKITDTHVDGNGVITLLSRAPGQQGWGGNVIGTLMEW